MKSSIAIFIYLFLILTSAYPKTYTTVYYGYWEDSSTWLGGIAPDSVMTNDTIIIRHPVIFQHNLSLSQKSLLQVDSSGGAICGHRNITADQGSNLISYGLVEADSLFIPGGSVNLYRPAYMIITDQFKLTVTGAAFNNNGCAVDVGPWFNCHLPEYEKMSGIGSDHQGAMKINVFPDPSQGIFYFSGSGLQPGSIITIKDLTGKTILTRLIQDNDFDSEIINISNARNGVYLFEYISPAGITSSGKIVVAK